MGKQSEAASLSGVDGRLPLARADLGQRVFDMPTEDVVRRALLIQRDFWRHLALGAEDEDDARALAERLRSEAPQGSTLDVEGAAWDAWVAVNGPARPFALFGGLAQ